jgi:hypothetical protein
VTELIILSPNRKTTVMNNLEIEIRMVRVIRKVLSIILIFNAITWFISHFYKLMTFDLIYSVFLGTAGIVFLLWKTGIEMISIKSGNKMVFIKWIGKIRGKTLLFSDIDKIYLSRFEVMIDRRGRKRLKYRLDNLDYGQKKAVWDFIIELSAEKNLILVRQFGV